MTSSCIATAEFCFITGKATKDSGLRKKLKLKLLFLCDLARHDCHPLHAIDRRYVCALRLLRPQNPDPFPYSTTQDKREKNQQKTTLRNPCQNRNMHRPTISLLLASLPIPLSALTIPSIPLTLPPQNNPTLPPHLTLTLNTNNTNHRTLTNYLTPTCHLITTITSPLSTTKCAFLADDVCSDLALHGPRAHSTWVWAQIHGCALGYYLPVGAILPWRSTCEDGIFGAIREKCAGDPAGTKNAGSVNVGRMPDAAGDDDGTALWEGMGRYLLAPERLTV